MFLGNRQGLGYHQSSEDFKLGTQLNWKRVVVQSLEEPPELTGILGSHLHSSTLRWQLQAFLQPFSHRFENLLCNNFLFCSTM